MLTKIQCKTEIAKLLSGNETNETPVITSALMNLLNTGRCRFTPGKVKEAELVALLLKSNGIEIYKSRASSGITLGLSYLPSSDAM